MLINFKKSTFKFILLKAALKTLRTTQVRSLQQSAENFDQKSVKLIIYIKIKIYVNSENAFTESIIQVKIYVT